MKRIILIATLIFTACASAPAQASRTNARTEGHASASAQKGDELRALADARLDAQLQQTLDVRKARVGDEMVLKTTEAIKSNGRTVVAKGARLFGHVTDVRQRAQGSAASSISLVFDRLESGSLSAPISATITSITQARAQTQARDENTEAMSDARTSSSARAGGSSSGGGLLGGVTGTVGGVVDTTTNAAGQAVGATTNAVGGAANGVGRAVSGLRITQSAGADVSGGSTLSLAGGNLKLEKNTTFHLILKQSASVNNRDQ
ncbi:MAG: hypothetical protein QOF61_672 [Acidobacteriota bacterium]|nr:hypothetical protein [Acidobacteriota bacterium]